MSKQKPNQMISGASYGNAGSHKERVGKVMHWGDNGYSRASTQAYRDGMDQLCKDNTEQKRLAQEERAKARKEEIERIKKLLAG